MSYTDSDQPTGQRYPARIGVFCDQCGTTVEHDYIVSDDMGKAERYEVARNHLTENEGWVCTPWRDLCQSCASKPHP
ncbi:hypothetical protein [Streptomyces sp. A1136]|uniref:hypothetical protein n=1 Tax=Streptomyces sp. A1136 TaxID=2563102 RepID=UPI00109EC86E|nr:hypothetical protein [Streptomyces sp. A1136]THA56135.1 hypothetical protein E6R62_12380 [Streptomyces sp. A1136]